MQQKYVNRKTPHPKNTAVISHQEGMANAERVLR
jgi:hypothetical protein